MPATSEAIQRQRISVGRPTENSQRKGKKQPEEECALPREPQTIHGQTTTDFSLDLVGAVPAEGNSFLGFPANDHEYYLLRPPGKAVKLFRAY